MKCSKYVCHLCRSSIQSTRCGRPVLSLVKPFGRPPRRFTQTASLSSAPSLSISSTSGAKKSLDASTQFWGNDWTVFSADSAALVRKAQAFGEKIINSKSIPSEEEVVKVLEVIKYAALQLASTKAFKQAQSPWSEENKRDSVKEEKSLRSKPSASNEDRSSPNFVADILSLDASSPKPVAETTSSNQSSSNPVSVSIPTNLLSTLAYKILSHPPVFISPEVLAAYVAIQTSLHQNTTLPEILDLYAHKPVPVPESSPIRYKDPSPSKVSQAVPKEIADMALDSAIRDRELTVSLDTISAAYATPAFRRNKFIRKALPTISGLCITPFAAMPFARAWGESSVTADPNELAMYAFLGVLVYVGGAGGMGLIALTTHNDQMERVTWMRGMPLRHRWLREEERAAADKVAMAWGFKEKTRRGEEEGEEWETLRAWCGQRGMILDAPELMEGME